MKSFFKALRSIRVFNQLLRGILRFFSDKINSLKSLWLVVGNVGVSVDGESYKFYSDADDLIVNALYYDQSRYYEMDELIFFKKLSKHKKTIFDIGSNTGLYAIICSKPETNAKIYAFEPHPTNVKRIDTNIELNSMNKIVVEKLALGAKDDTISFFVPENDGLTTMSSPNESFSTRKINENRNTSNKLKIKEIKVNQTSVDNYVVQNAVKDLDLVKIDVETYEMEVFKGAVDTFSKFKPTIFCEIFLNEERVEYFNKFVQKAGLNPYMVTKEGVHKLRDGLSLKTKGSKFIFSPINTPLNYYTFSNNMADLVKAFS